MKTIVKTAKIGNKLSTVKAPAKKLVAATKKVEAKPAKEKLVDRILRQTVEMKIDGPTAWLGNGTSAEHYDALVALAPKLKKEKLAKTTNVLFVSGKVGFAWPLTGLSTSAYERKHGETPVRGSLDLLKKTYGKAAVKIVSIEKLKEMATKLKIDLGCKRALGLTGA